MGLNDVLPDVAEVEQMMEFSHSSFRRFAMVGMISLLAVSSRAVAQQVITCDNADFDTYR